jgi:hypothetical protein
MGQLQAVDRFDSEIQVHDKMPAPSWRVLMLVNSPVEKRLTLIFEPCHYYESIDAYCAVVAATSKNIKQFLDEARASLACRRKTTAVPS